MYIRDTNQIVPGPSFRIDLRLSAIYLMETEDGEKDLHNQENKYVMYQSKKEHSVQTSQRSEIIRLSFFESFLLTFNTTLQSLFKQDTKH